MERFDDIRGFDLNLPINEVEEVEQDPNLWTIRKKLSASDANPNRSEIILPGQQVRDHLLPNLPHLKREILRSGRPILINLTNDDILRTYRIKFNFKKTTSSFMLQETRMLVTEGNLKARKEIKFKWVRGNDFEEGRLHFSLLP